MHTNFGQKYLKTAIVRTVGTYFANRLQINFIELGLDSHFLVTGRASKVINTPKIEDNYWY